MAFEETQGDFLDAASGFKPASFLANAVLDRQQISCNCGQVIKLADFS